MTTPLHKKTKALQQIARDLATTCPCPLKKTATQPVPGEGHPDADIMFIGEAPGRQEDISGKPFIGAAGKMLASLLAEIGIAREETFITSIEKFRPPDNREPRPAEVMACFPYLERQINAIEPKLIVTLGRHALRRMLEWEKGEVLKGGISMDELHGKVIVGKSGRRYFPIHHPAAILYHRSLLETVRKDMKEIPKIIKKR